MAAQRRRTRRRTGRVSQGERGGRVWAGPQETTGRCKISDDDIYDTHALPDFAAYFVRHVVLCKASFVLLFMSTSHRPSLSVSVALARGPSVCWVHSRSFNTSHYAVYLSRPSFPSSRSVSSVHSSLFFIFSRSPHHPSSRRLLRYRTSHLYYSCSLVLLSAFCVRIRNP